MFFDARKTSTSPKPLIISDGDAAEGVFDAKPIDLWDAWQFAATEATLKLRIWSTAPTEDKTNAHAAYRAALDREEQAARVLADRLRPATEGA
jgi:hypothetical protein